MFSGTQRRSIKIERVINKYLTSTFLAAVVSTSSRCCWSITVIHPVLPFHIDVSTMVHLSIPSKLKPGSRPGTPGPSRSSTPRPDAQPATPTMTLTLQVMIIQVSPVFAVSSLSCIFVNSIRLGAKSHWKRQKWHQRSCMASSRKLVC